MKLLCLHADMERREQQKLLINVASIEVYSVNVQLLGLLQLLYSKKSIKIILKFTTQETKQVMVVKPTDLYNPAGVYVVDLLSPSCWCPE